MHAVLASEPPPLEVIVVDDGSSDGTAEALLASVGGDPRVRLIRQTNQGKAAALNHALAAARGEIVVCLDADTLFVPDTIAHLTRHLPSDQDLFAWLAFGVVVLLLSCRSPESDRRPLIQ